MSIFSVCIDKRWCLQGRARVRYLEKLHLVGLEDSDDLYSESNSPPTGSVSLGRMETSRTSCLHPSQSAWCIRMHSNSLASSKLVADSICPVQSYVLFANHSISHTLINTFDKRLPRPSARALYLNYLK